MAGGGTAIPALWAPVLGAAVAFALFWLAQAALLFSPRLALAARRGRRAAAAACRCGRAAGKGRRGGEGGEEGEEGAGFGASEGEEDAEGAGEPAAAAGEGPATAPPTNLAWARIGVVVATPSGPKTLLQARARGAASAEAA